MRKVIYVLLVLSLMAIPLLTAESAEIFRHNFFNDYDPISTSFVYTDDPADTSATGDQVAVNTYLQKSIQITGVNVGESIQIRIEGRSKNQIDAAGATEVDNFAILDIVEFEAASSDQAINKIVDVTEYVDFLRVGIRQLDPNAVSSIDIEGIFTNLER